MLHPNICRRIADGLVLLGIIVAGAAVFACGFRPMPLGFIAGAAVSFGGVIFGAVTVRCPDCGQPLDLHGTKLRCCSHCGRMIR